MNLHNQATGEDDQTSMYVACTVCHTQPQLIHSMYAGPAGVLLDEISCECYIFSHQCISIYRPSMACSVLKHQPKLEFYNMNVFNCFAYPVCSFTVQGFTCLQIKRGNTAQ